MRYLEQGYRGDLLAIGNTTCWDKRRKGIKRVVASLKLASVLDYIEQDERESRIKKCVKCRLVLNEWDDK